MRKRRNIDEDAIPASGGTSPTDPLSYNKAIQTLQDKSKKQIDRFASLATFVERMKLHLEITAMSLDGGLKRDKDRAKRIRKVLSEYEAWKISDN